MQPAPVSPARDKRGLSLLRLRAALLRVSAAQRATKTKTKKTRLPCLALHVVHAHLVLAGRDGVEAVYALAVHFGRQLAEPSGPRRERSRKADVCLGGTWTQVAGRVCS